MSLSVLTQGGGGTGGAAASIFVTGLSEEDYVTAVKDGKAVRGKWNSAESRFEITPIKEYGMWTVTATNGEDTTTQDVLVDAAVEYEIEMYFKKLIYRGTASGESYYSPEWQYKAPDASHTPTTYPTVHHSEEKIYGSATEMYAGQRFVQFNEKIELTRFDTIRLIVVANNASNRVFGAALTPTYNSATPSGEFLFIEWKESSQSSAEQEVLYDISEIDTDGYLSVAVKMTGNEIHEIWLE